jgi:hypothetical protein
VSGEVVKDSEGDIVGGKRVNPNTESPNTEEEGLQEGTEGEKLKAESRKQNSFRRGTDRKPKAEDSQEETEDQVEAADASGGFDQVASERLAAAVAEDLRPVMERLNAVLAIEDGPLMQSKLRLLLEEIDRLKGDVTRDPESARVIQEVLAAGFAEGISRKAESRK